MTPTEIRDRCARAVCEGCRLGVPRFLEDVVYENKPMTVQQAWIHITEAGFKKACDANGIYEIPDEELAS